MSTRRERRTKERMKTLDKKEEVAKEIWLPILLHPLVDLLTTCEAFVANYFSSKLHHHTGVTNLHLVTALRTFTPSALACLGAYCERCTARTIGQSANVCSMHCATRVEITKQDYAMFSVHTTSLQYRRQRSARQIPVHQNFANSPCSTEQDCTCYCHLPLQEGVYS